MGKGEVRNGLLGNQHRRRTDDIDYGVWRFGVYPADVPRLCHDRHTGALRGLGD